MEKKVTFSKASEKDVTRAIVSEFTKQFSEYVESDVIVVGGGPSGLMAGRELASKGIKVLIIERNNFALSGINANREFLYLLIVLFAFFGG